MEYSEKEIQNFWEKEEIYKYDPRKGGQKFTIDTAPPTISGKMHIGHASSYTHEDVVVRFERMMGKNVLFPFGTDDNGLPTERFIEKENQIKATSMDRKDFIDLCEKTLEKTRPSFIESWKEIGMSCDFNLNYSTIDKESQKISQKFFLDLIKKNLAYRKEAPMLWCPTCQTAVAQAELEDKKVSSFFYDILFDLKEGGQITIATTRPEMLASCAAIFVNPEDERYSALVGKKALVPLFGQEVEIMADEKVDIEKGTGIVMCCTFGDTTDIEWYLQYNLPLKMSISENGKMTSLLGDLEGLEIKEARKKIIEKLKSENRVVSEKPIEHLVNIHERCGTEIEILPTPQWFIKILDHKNKFIENGRKINWEPEYMIHRYENWIENLKWDWCVSRQRFFGIPIPVWYCEKCGEIIVPEENELPVYPLSEERICPKCQSKAIGEKDVLDTWATSSLTPQILENLTQEELIPMNLRGHAHDIISTWLFYTVVRSEYIKESIPWKNVIISGFVLDSKGEKMSKSKGNIVEPSKVIEKYGADALRYWSLNVQFGKDIRYDENELKNGKKLINKLLNAVKFASSNLNNNPPEKLYPLDEYYLIKLNKTIKKVTSLYEKRDISQAKGVIEKFFWNDFCDNYLELSKWRIYEDKDKNSAGWTLYFSLLNIIKMFAPIIPFVTEKIYQEYFKEEKSIHLTNFPKYNPELINEELEKRGDQMIEYLQEARKIKSEKGISQKTEIEEFIIEKDISSFEEDLIKTGNIKKLSKKI